MRSPESRTRNPDDTRIRLVAFDMEGCLTADPTVWEIMHRKIGTWESHGQPYWDHYRAGEFGYDEFASMDVAAWRGAPASLLAEAANEVPLMPGCTEALDSLAEAGVHVAIISNGLLDVADRFRQHGVRHIHANRVIARAGRIEGIEILVPYHSKGDVLRKLSTELGLGKRQIAAVGDSVSDIAMFREARIGIAFRPFHPSVAEAATHHVQHDDLREVLRLMVPRTEIV